MKARIVSVLAIASLAGALPAAVDPQLIGLTMPDVKLLAGVYPDRLPGTLQQFLLSQFPQAAATELRLILGAPGLDQTRDIHEMLFATVDPSESVGLVLARGVFNVSQMTDYLVSQGHTTGDYNGVPLISSADQTVAVAFPDGSLAIIGSATDVTAAIDRGTSPSQPDATLVSQAKQLSATQDAWAVSIFKPDPPKDPTTIRDIALGALANVQFASAGMTFGATVQFAVQGQMDSVQNCSVMASVIRLTAALTQTDQGSQADPALAALLQNLAITVKGTTLTLSLALPGDQFMQLAPVHVEQKPRRRAALK